jgi:8-oxo-dGTP pyrophosphatase MutT (NUDIX family)
MLACLFLALLPGPPGHQPPPRPSARVAVAGADRAGVGHARGSDPGPPSASVRAPAAPLSPSATALSRARATERARAASKHEAMQMLRTARPDKRPGHTFSGIEVAAAGVMPFVHHREGVYFLMQELSNGTRAGLLSDFGGRREDTDKDAYHTAARELSEETCGAFGDVHALAVRLRKESYIRILNKSGRYITFFLEVPYIHHMHIQAFDNTTSEGGVARTCRWLRADQIICEVERGRGESAPARPSTAPTSPPSASRTHSWK